MFVRIKNWIAGTVVQGKQKKIQKKFALRNIKTGTGNIFNDVVFDTSRGGEIEIGSSNEILNGCLLMTYGGSIQIENNCSINPYTILYGHGKGLVIGNNVLIAGHCLIIPSNHNFSQPDLLIRLQGSTSSGVVIEDDVWIGAGCQILDGVTIGKGVIVAAGSVVNRSVEPYMIVGGVPAKFLKQRGK